jgi:alginate O-acetyltransferase complex protein AlgI
VLALVVLVPPLLVLGALLRAARFPRAERAVGLLLVPGGLALAVVLAQDAPAPWRFATGSAAMFFALKIAAHGAWRASGRAALPLPAWLLWTTFAVGMNPGPFDPAARRRRRGAGVRVVRGGACLAVAAAGWLLLAHAWRAGAPAGLVHVGQLVGILAALRFGVDPLLDGVLRTRGVLVTPLFRAPERSRSLAEFWSRRWNRPFSEMLQLLVERPVRARFGRRVAVAAAFAASGLLHEAAVSVPVGAGFGRPSAYFALQLLLVALERRTGLLAALSPAGRRAWTLAWTVLPAVLVFHPPFLAGVLAPLLGPRG